MSYIDKTFWHDQGNREIEVLNHKDGWKGDWDIDYLTLRKRATDSANGDDIGISIEVYPYDKKKEPYEIILSQENAQLLAHKLLMSLNEINTENIIFSLKEDMQGIKQKMEWLQPVVTEQIKKWKEGEKKYGKGK